MPDLFATDGLTVALGLAAASAFLLHTLLTPQSLVHPILLGRQSDVDRVRKPGESALYRNYGTGLMSRLPSRPAEGIKTLLDLVKPDFSSSRSLWGTSLTNEQLKQRVNSLGSGLVRITGLQPKESNVLLLLNDGLDFLIADLALASLSIPSLTISSLTLLSAVLDAQPPSAIILHIEFLSRVLEQIAENHEYAHHTLILVGEGDLPAVVNKLQIKVVWLADLERKGAKLEPVQPPSIVPSDVFSVSFYPGPNNELKATQLTHENITAGVAATRALLPFTGTISSSDSILSSHSVSTPFGRAVAYTAIFENSHISSTTAVNLFTTESGRTSDILKDLELLSVPATIVLLTPSQLNTIVSSILSEAKRSPLFPLAWRHKLSHILQGFLSKDSLWDKSFFSAARSATLKKSSESLRAVIVSGGSIESKLPTSARVALSVPLVNVHENPLVTGPVFFSHPLDFQSFQPNHDSATPQFEGIHHVGPPSINVEVKLLGVNDAAVEAGADPVGEVVVRGPSVTLPLEEDKGSQPNDWVRLEEIALVQANGTFKVIPATKFHI